MFRVEIKDGAVEEFSGISKKTNQPFTIRKQKGWLHNPAWEYPKEIDIPLREQRAPYNEGEYQVAASSFYVGRFGDLQISLELEPMVSRNVRSAA